MSQDRNPRGLEPGRWYAITIEDCCVLGEANMRFVRYELVDGDIDKVDDTIGTGIYWFDGGDGSQAILGLEQWGWEADDAPVAHLNEEVQ